ncbi:T9SS type A sorting domain-containing protein, partial [Crocinitomicaceae bacterium]|nr:T9SS type A sorting domain-containing protein [Crocinitomicaceae bacterium]
QTISNAPEYGIYAWWDDLDTDFGDVYYETIGAPGNQKFIVQYDDKNFFFGPAGEVITFQIVIDEATGEIWSLYDDTEFGGSDAQYDDGASATIGISGPSQDLQVSYNNATYLENNSCVHYYYTDCPTPSNFAVTYTTVNEGAITWSAGLANETDWTVIYGLAGFDPTQSGTTVQTSTPALIMPGLNDITCYDVYIYADCSGGLQSGAVTGTFCTLPNCANPSAISALSATDTVMSSWSWVENPGYPSTGFGVQYGFAGFTPGTGTVAYIDNNFTDTTADAALIGGGVYDIYVQAVCGTDSSAWTGPIAFTMPLSNDSTCFAEDLAVDGTFMTFSNVGATTDANEGTIAPPATGYQTQNGWGNSNVTSTVWFTFTAPPSGNVRASCEGINFDGQLAAYEVTQCDSFPTYTLIGANDDLGVSFTQNAPLLNLCGLTPGAQYYLMYDSWSTFSQGTYNLTLSEVVVEAGTDNGLSNVCIGDTADLFNNLTGNDLGGTWYEQIPTANFNESNFVSTGLASQVFYFDYVVVDGCAVDSVETSVEVYPPSSAGQDGTITACQNQPINLLGGLVGNVDFGGQWYDPSNSPTSAAITASSIPGQFNYDYITGNGVCPDDTANVIVDVDLDCDYLNLQEVYFQGMDVYPNPTTGMIYISNNGSDEVYNIELTDLNGKVIRALNSAINGTETTEVSLEQFETGFYLIRVFNENAEKT